MKDVQPRGQHDSIEVLLQRFGQYLIRFANPQNDINRKRTETLQACIARAEDPPGYFTLTVPTGGGKTLSSMAFALNHAKKHHLERVIYIIPFTSIIEQNAAIFKDCLGAANVLEHHSNFDWKNNSAAVEVDDQTNNALEKLRLASENWDIPIVVTTNVQFFESMFSNRSSSCRKIHNIARSVLIFDEAQMLPRDFLQPCLYALRELVTNYGCTVVFCTATQPALDRLGFLPNEAKITELAPNPQGLFDFYRRVDILNRGKIADEDLLMELNSHNQVLCIVNTRCHASGLFGGLLEEGRFHLSTLMCPAHRIKTLAEIRQRLQEGLTCRVVSTQVLEAGIDVDFPTGFRALAGLDSIIQAAGRVNREAKCVRGTMYVFEPDSPLVKRFPTYIQQGAEVASSVLRDYSVDPVTIPAIQAYYNCLYTLQNAKTTFDTHEVLPCFEKNVADAVFNFQTATERFKLIDDNQETIIIPFEKEAKELLDKVNHSMYPASFARQLQKYSVNLYAQEVDALRSKGALQMAAETFEYLDPGQMSDYYHPQTGVKIPEIGGDAIVF
jgi:CRISPR-associated endonuclease/helicase Cas3